MLLLPVVELPWSSPGLHFSFTPRFLCSDSTRFVGASGTSEIQTTATRTLDSENKQQSMQIMCSNPSHATTHISLTPISHELSLTLISHAQISHTLCHTQISLSLFLSPSLSLSLLHPSSSHLSCPKKVTSEYKHRAYFSGVDYRWRWTPVCDEC